MTRRRNDDDGKVVDLHEFLTRKVHAEAKRQGYLIVPGSTVARHGRNHYAIRVIKNGKPVWLHLKLEVERDQVRGRFLLSRKERR